MEKLYHIEGKINCGRKNLAFIERFRTVCKSVKGFCNLNSRRNLRNLPKKKIIKGVF